MNKQNPSVILDLEEANAPNAKVPPRVKKAVKQAAKQAAKKAAPSKLKQAQDTAQVLGLILLTIIAVLAMVLPKLVRLVKQGQRAMAELRNNEEALRVGVAEMARKEEERAEAEFDRRVARSMKKAAQGQNNGARV